MPPFGGTQPAPDANLGPNANPDWPEAMATVTACRYESRVGRAIAFGLPASRHFRISYHYWAGDAEHTGEFYAQKAMPAGTLFPLRYDPEKTASNEYDRRDTPALPDWTARFALAALVGFFAGLLTMPVACGGFVLVNEHRFGDVQSGGPFAMLGGIAVGFLVGLATAALVWRKSRPR